MFVQLHHIQPQIKYSFLTHYPNMYLIPTKYIIHDDLIFHIVSRVKYNIYHIGIIRQNMNKVLEMVC